MGREGGHLGGARRVRGSVDEALICMQCVLREGEAAALSSDHLTTCLFRDKECDLPV